jgi:hypothetical protein
MPSFLIMTPGRTGEATDAVLCDPNTVTVYPDRASAVPVKATISEKAIRIDDEPRPRAIISAVGKNGISTILISGTTGALQNRERRAALARASSLLQQLASCVTPLKSDSDEPGLLVEALGLLFDWIRDERERAKGAWR